MKQIHLIVLLTLALLTPLLGTDPPSDQERIAAVIDDSIGWFKTKNFDRLFEIFPEDPDLVLFHPNAKDTVIGGKAFRDGSALWKNPGNVYVSHEIRDLRIKLSESGTVAWWSAILDDCGSYGGRTFCWKDCRWTGVVEKRAEKWVIVQAHFSFGADQVAEQIKARETLTDETFTDYMSLRKRVAELFGEQKYAAAEGLLKKSLDQFPDRVMANLFNLTLVALRQNAPEKALYWLEEVHRRGLFFGIWAFDDEMWQPLRDLPRFQTLLKENEKRLASAQAGAVMKLELVKPEGYDPKRKYPLFIALHGGGETIAAFRPHWTSPMLQKKYVVAYVQSTQVADMNGFHWQDDAISHRDLTEAYRQIQEQASIDPERVLIGGFSSGGYGAVSAILAGVIPARGFIVLCPVPPEIKDPAVLTELRKKRLKGTLLTTELDQRVPQQKAFVQQMNQARIPVRLVVTPNIGHWYPENLPELIDRALQELAK
jgi:acetyl esterase/lipase